MMYKKKHNHRSKPTHSTRRENGRERTNSTAYILVSTHAFIALPLVCYNFMLFLAFVCLKITVGVGGVAGGCLSGFYDMSILTLVCHDSK